MGKEIKMSYSEYESMINEIKDLKEKVEKLSSGLPMINISYGHSYHRPYIIEIVSLDKGTNTVIDKFKENEKRLIDELVEMHFICRKLKSSIKKSNEMGIFKKMFHIINY